MMSRKGPGSRITGGKKWKGTVENDSHNKSLSVETVRLLKTQDMGYVRTMRQVVAKEIARLEQQVVLTRGLDHLDDGDDDGYSVDDDMGSDDEDDRLIPSKPKATRKIVFLDTEEEQEAALQRLDEEQQQKKQEGDGECSDEDGAMDADEDGDDQAKSLRQLKRQLENAKKKLKALDDAEAALDVQRAKMAKTATSGGHTRRGKKIMVRTRKR